MLRTTSIFSAALSLAGLARAAVSPLTPATLTVGTQAQAQWTADTTGTWNNMTIQLMAGSNWDMQTLTTIATGVDGTTATSYAFTVPEVSPYSPIYFLQFTANGGISTAMWTTRFMITNAAMSSVAPISSIEPDGQTIPWGTASVAGQANNGAISASVTSSGSASSSRTSSVMSTSSSAASSSSQTSSSSSSESASAASVSTTPASSGAENLKAGSHVAGAGLALVAVAAYILA